VGATQTTGDVARMRLPHRGEKFFKLASSAAAQRIEPASHALSGTILAQEPSKFRAILSFDLLVQPRSVPYIHRVRPPVPTRRDR
jgi:hypothetical protein